MVAVPFAVSSAPGARPQEGAGVNENVFAEQSEQGARSQIIWRRSPGVLKLFDTSDHSHTRGMINVDGTLVWVLDNRAYSVTESSGVYTVTNRGALSGSDKVIIAKNNASTPNIVCVADAGVFNLFTSSAPTTFADGDLPGSPNDVANFDGYLVFTYGDGRIFATDLNSVSVSALSFVQSQFDSEGLVRGISRDDDYLAFGPNRIGVYENAGLSPFPLRRTQVIPGPGLAGKHAVAGFEESFAGVTCYAGSDNTVRRLDGYTPFRISNSDIERDIAAVSDKSLLEASVYTLGGHAFWVLTYPGFWTWEHNLTTGEWNNRKSSARNDWRASCSVRAFGEWVIGDRTTGNIGAVREARYDEFDAPLIARMVSGAVTGFPAGLNAARVEFDITAAVGVASGRDPEQTSPTVQIRWSRDGGYSWSNYVTREIGRQGDAKRRVQVNRLGQAGPKGFRFELQFSDDVPFTVMGGEVFAESRAV